MVEDLRLCRSRGLALSKAPSCELGRGANLAALFDPRHTDTAKKDGTQRSNGHQIWKKFVLESSPLVHESVQLVGRENRGREGVEGSKIDIGSESSSAGGLS
eukprot:2489588-Rhodomonas_salina.2